MASPETTKKPAKPSTRAPLTAYHRARIEWFERYGSAIVDKNRFAVLFGISLLLNVAAILALAGLTPLKTVVPVIVRTADTGRVVSVEQSTTEFKPGEAEIKYWIGQFTTKLMTLDPTMTKRNLQDVYNVSTNKAVHELNDYMAKWQPLTALGVDPSLTRNVQIVTMQRYNNEDVYMVRFVTEARSGTQTSIKKTWLLTIHFMVVPPKEDRDALVNPLGLYVTHFTLNEEMAGGGTR